MIQAAAEIAFMNKSPWFITRGGHNTVSKVSCYKAILMLEGILS
jgi:hypothetical protein